MTYFKFKNKNEYLPEFIIDFLKKNKIDEPFEEKIGEVTFHYDICYIDKSYLRKLKLQNINNSISYDDKMFIEYFLNPNFVDFIGDKIPESVDYWFPSIRAGVTYSM